MPEQIPKGPLKLMTAMMTPLIMIFQEICSAMLRVQPSHSAEGGRGERLQSQGVRQGLAPGVLQMRGMSADSTQPIIEKRCVVSIIQFYLSFQSGLRLRAGRGRRQKVLPEGRHTPLPRLQQGEEVMSWMAV